MNYSAWAFSVCCTALLLTFGLETVAAGNDEDHSYFEALRQRRLWVLAEVVLQRDLAANAEPGTRRTELLIELSSTFSAHGCDAVQSADRDELWSQARHLLEAELERELPREHRLLLTVQNGFLIHDELYTRRLLVELTPFVTAANEQFRVILENAVTQLSDLDQQLDTFKLPSDTTSAGVRRDRIPVDLRALRREIQWRLAEAVLWRGMSRPQESPDRAADILSAEQHLRKVIGGPRDQMAVQKANLLLARLRRIRGEVTRAKALLESLSDISAQHGLADEFVCELAECQLALHQPVEAADLLKKHLASQPRSGRIGYLLVASLLELSDMARQRGDESLANDLFSEAELRSAPQAGSANQYWTLRSQMIVEHAQSRRRYGDDIAAALAEGRGRLTAGEVPAATTAFQRAYEAQLAVEPTEDSLDWGLTIARLMIQQQKFEETVRFLTDVLRTHPDQSQRADADFLRAICRGRLYQAAPTSKSRELFIQSLEAHLSSYPTSKTAADANQMLEQVREKLKTVEAPSVAVTPQKSTSDSGFSPPPANLSLAEKKTYWRKLEQKLPAGSPNWIRARTETILLCVALGEHSEAQKLVRVTRLLHPELGDSESRSNFEKAATQASRDSK